MINELEKQLAAMTIDETKKSPIGEALEKGSATVQGKDRKIIKASRLTNQGKQSQQVSEQERLKDKLMFKATLKKGNEEDSDWESVEEDFPHVKLEELLGNLTLDDGPKISNHDSDNEEKKPYS